ncbi:hypothetical protein PENANT_c013G08413 [Penicillium antarcticum]|uniref:mRNA-capping enzyme subunit beta n=1 Tax=Penicillium antarcticum TaxID=416450 RepID=A0A1V6Q569_9EURO|nr:uncharacterized protein N7508_004300 [Penicillium antarcticum]KAJ5308921.1 hypothetical protein N7508_004300 [Penicillium antarcticum]OQD84391.1 hypothetical protein PENANT_c013G08413 [Penicillium antarcticum]
MDLRTIMNSDAGASNPPPPNNSTSSPISAQAPPKRTKKSASYSEYSAHPPQHPLQPSHAPPNQTSPYTAAQSPYQQYHGPGVNTAVQAQRGQSPAHISTPYGSATRDQFGASGYPTHPQHPSGPLASPYTPQPMSAGSQQPDQQSYFAQQRSHSLQSVVTTPGPPTEPFRPRDSPPAASDAVPSQHFSPSAHRSVPGTPLGPPPTFASRQSPSTVRPPSSGHDSRNPLSSPRGALEFQARDHVQTQSPGAQRHLSGHSPRPSEPIHPPSVGFKREPIDSASPQSTRHNSIAGTSEPAASGPTRSSEDRKLVDSPTAPKPISAGSDLFTSPTAPSSQGNSSPSGPRGGVHPLTMEIDNAPQVEPQQPKQKRRRYNEPPIYAQRSVRTRGKCPPIPHPRPPIPKHERPTQQETWAARRRSSSTMAATPSARVTRAPTVASPSTNGPTPVQAPPSKSAGSLGPWEPSITGFIPHEEVTKTLCDFLFKHVVLRTDVNAGPAGSAAAGQGAIIEVEAKLGHIIDMDSRDRVNLPILTESVINRESGRFRTSFESTMTVEQHRAMNNFLNETVKASMPQQNPTRIPLSYAHKKERDTFYEVQASDLPPIIRQNLNPRHKPKVRVTTDQRTGEVLAKIVKCRVADIDVCSPRTTVDWRVSVNLEMEYPGDVSTLTAVDVAGRGERNKDRMSYSHLAYQVDLTQVAKSEQQPGKNEFEHELEVEVSAAEIRRQGQLAMAGDPKNQYEDLVKGFVDNIRLLARAVPP